ncbi:MAG: hypothetical protein IIT39_00345, partial [Clostridia bacterium]|nr:hypothetical protein [Clostridia bacterium]
MSKKSSNKNKVPPSAQFIIEGMDIIKKHPLFGCMNYYDRIRDFDDKEKSGSAYVTSAGYMVFNKNKRHSPQEWAYIIAHLILHLGLG